MSNILTAARECGATWPTANPIYYLQSAQRKVSLSSRLRVSCSLTDVIRYDTYLHAAQQELATARSDHSALKEAYDSEKAQLRRHIDLVEAQLDTVHAKWYLHSCIHTDCPRIFLSLDDAVAGLCLLLMHTDRLLCPGARSLATHTSSSIATKRSLTMLMSVPVPGILISI